MLGLAFVARDNADMLINASLLSFSAVLGWYWGGSGSILVRMAQAVAWVLHAVFKLVTFQRRGTKMAKVSKVIWRLLQLLGPLQSAAGEGGLLKALEATDEWREFVRAAAGTKQRKNMLVLDLDETLIHASLERKSLCEPEFLLYDEDYRLHYYVYKRPFVDLFLRVLSKFYDVSLYTASNASYSEPILETIDPTSIISKRLNSSSLVETKLYGMQKDLQLVSKEHMPCRLVMVDNSEAACMANQENLYVVSSFKANQPMDRDLLSLLLLLVAMSDLDDVRSVLHRRRVFGDK